MSKSRGNTWPVVWVLVVALVVIVVPRVVRYSQASSGMAAVDAQVSISDKTIDPLTHSESQMYRWPSGEVSRTAERPRAAGQSQDTTAQPSPRDRARRPDAVPAAAVAQPGVRRRAGLELGDVSLVRDRTRVRWQRARLGPHRAEWL